jgi:hypothetical protein
LDFYPDEIICQIDATKPPVQVINQITSVILDLPTYKEREGLII